MTIDSQISEREREILRLVATGATNQQIAHQLHISVNTVKVHLRNIFGKIGVASRTEATVYAIRQGLLDVADAAAVEPATTEVLVAEDEPPANAGENADAQDRWNVAADVPAAPGPSPTRVDVSSPEPMITPEAVTSHTAARGTRRTPWLVGLASVCVLLAAALIYVLVRDERPPTLPAQATVLPQSAGPQVGHWKTHAPLSQPRADFAATAYEGKLYIIGGTVAQGASAILERYDPATDQSAALANKPTPASRIQATTFGGRIFVPGGEASGAPLAVFEAYDPRAMQWEALPPLPAPRSRYAVANLDGRVYVFGGWDGKTCVADVFIYDPGAKQWSTSDAMPTPRCNAGAAVIEGQIYVVGGENDSGAVRVNERYDPTRAAGRQWENDLLPLPAAVGAPALVEFARTVLVFDPNERTAVQYYPRTDTWAAVAIAKDTALSNRAVALGSNIFTFGQSAADQPAVVSEYQAGYNTFLPSLSTSDK